MKTPAGWPLAAGGLLLIVAAVGIPVMLMRKTGTPKDRPQTAAVAPAEDPAQRAATEEEARLALRCVDRFFAAEADLLRVAQLRPGPGLTERYQTGRAELLRLRAAGVTPGGVVRREPPFFAIPLHLPGEPPRLAWVEIRNGNARLDLDSLVGTGSLPWTELAASPPGTRVTLRGRLQPQTPSSTEGPDPAGATATATGTGTVRFTSPDGSHTLQLDPTGCPATEQPRDLRLRLERLPATTFRHADWRIVEILGEDWLERRE